MGFFWIGSDSKSDLGRKRASQRSAIGAEELLASLMRNAFNRMGRAFFATSSPLLQGVQVLQRSHKSEQSRNRKLSRKCCSTTVTDSYLFDGNRVVGQSLALRQLCVLSFQRQQLVSLLQMPHSLDFIDMKHLWHPHAEIVFFFTFWSMTSKLFFSLWKFSFSCWACKVIWEDCFFRVMILSCGITGRGRNQQGGWLYHSAGGKKIKVKFAVRLRAVV